MLERLIELEKLKKAQKVWKTGKAWRVEIMQTWENCQRTTTRKYKDIEAREAWAGGAFLMDMWYVFWIKW